MGLQLSQVRTKFAASLLDAVKLFGETAEQQAPILDAQLQTACRSLSRVLPRVVEASLALEAGQAGYTAPADAIDFVSSRAVDRNAEREPFDPLWMAQIPVPTLSLAGSTRRWLFRPVPCSRFLGIFGSAYAYEYAASHLLSDTPAETTLPDEFEPLLILRAQVEAMRALAIRNAHKPVAMRDAVYSQTKNGTPAALADLFMKLFEQETRHTAETWKTFQ